MQMEDVPRRTHEHSEVVWHCGHDTAQGVLSGRVSFVLQDLEHLAPSPPVLCAEALPPTPLPLFSVPWPYDM